MEYPIYRKNVPGNSFFRIVNEEEFYELKVSSTFYSIYHIKATIHPERMLINDLLLMENKFYIGSSNEEFTGKLLHCITQLKKI